MKPQRSCDSVLLIVTLILIAFGLAVISSASFVISWENFKTTTYYFYHQLYFGVLPGLLLAFLVYKVDYHVWKKFAVPGLVLAIILLFLVFLPSVSISSGGARRWIKIPFAGGFSFQAAEFAKLAFVIYLASWLEKREKEVKSLSTGLMPFSLMLGAISLLLIIQPDVGTLSVIAISAVIMYYLAGAKTRHLLLAMTGAATALTVLVQFSPYRFNRFLVFLHPEIDPQGIGYQINQALLAIGSGGFFGRGYGASRQKFSYLPESMGDSIFAIISEELGFIGAMAVISLFLVFAWRGFKIARKAPDNFGMLLAGGITSLIVFQALINIGAITSIFPLTGIPLPFISYGGSSMIIFLVATAILLNISKYSKR